jgi:hypothetical protein
MSSGKPAGAGYKRSWRNYLLNARYQLRFTGVLVAVCVALMVVMGWNHDLGRGAFWVTQRSFWPEGPKILEVDGNWPSIMGAAENATKVGESSLKGATFDFADSARDEQIRAEKIAELRAKESMLSWILIGAVVLISMGLFAFGITMTHKVAGPLFKISLYLDKMKRGKFDKVYNLRKGDQLVEFFEHFKQAHGALRELQIRDVTQLKALIAQAERHETLGRSPTLAELRALVAEKEVGLG